MKAIWVRRVGCWTVLVLTLGIILNMIFLRMMITLKFRIKNRQLKTYSFEG